MSSVTRRNDVYHRGNPPDELDAERESDLPEESQIWSFEARGWRNSAGLVRLWKCVESQKPGREREATHCLQETKTQTVGYPRFKGGHPPEIVLKVSRLAYTWFGRGEG